MTSDTLVSVRPGYKRGSLTLNDAHERSLFNRRLLPLSVSRQSTNVYGDILPRLDANRYVTLICKEIKLLPRD